MSRPCSICRHPKRDEIELALAAGRPFRNVAKVTGTNSTALFRHSRAHLPVGLVEAEKGRQLRAAEEFLVALEELHALTTGALTKAKEKGDLTAIARLVVAAKGIIETSARLTGELRDTPAQVAVVLSWGDEAGFSASSGASDPSTTIALPPASYTVEAEALQPPTPKDGEP